MWTEFFRPRTLDEVVGQQEIVERLKQLVTRADFPHMLFSGPPGVGKTTSAEAVINEIFPFAQRSANVKRLNASDDRGINVVREDIKNFARVLPSGGAKFKLIILDEADQMTSEAQHALRRTMETYNEITRFILICNYSSKIISPIQSRCAIFRFKGLRKEEVISRLEYIATSKKLDISEKGLEALYESSEGDMRQAINALQAAASLTKEVTDKVVYQVQGYIKPAELSEIIFNCIGPKPNFSVARKKVVNLMESYGLSGQDLVKQFNSQLSSIPEKDLPGSLRYEALAMLADVDYRLASGCNPLVQFDAFLAKLIAISQS
ncbi:MAG: replication factor C small subunit [Candidatus Hodarchaeales archaeon]|jgi:replication factor C small subunit